MKKFIYGAIILATAAMMASCCGGSSQYITMGKKSQMDSLSYALGYSVSYGTKTAMPDVRMDWDEVTKGAFESIVIPVTVEEDETYKMVYDTLSNFFYHKRQDRLREMQILATAEDSTAVFNPADVDIFENEEERMAISYAYGYDFGFNVRTSRMPLQKYWIAEGIKAGLAEDAAAAEEGFKQTQNYMRRYYTEILPVKNAERAAEWLSKVEKKSGVQKTESGLLYRIDRAGDENVKPTAEDKVKVDYEGKLLDGVIFDSSYKRGEPIEFPLNAVIKGWTEGMQLVGKGGQITLWIPAELAYGPRGGGSIGPNEALEFKVELHDVIKPGQIAEEVVEEPAAEEVVEE